MRLIPSLTFMAVLGCFATMVSADAQDAKLLALLQSKNKQIDAAMIKGDVTPVLDLISPTVMATDPVGAYLSREDLVESIKTGRLKYTSIAMSDEKLAQFGDAAVLTFASTESGTVQGHDLSGKYRYTQVWGRQAGQWKLVAIQLTRVITGEGR